MVIFFAACSSGKGKEAARRAGVRNFLLSYAGGRSSFDMNADILCDTDCRLLVDSGAFSAWASKKAISIKDYVEFCHWLVETSVCQIRFVNLDVIPGEFGRKPTAAEREESARRGWDNFMLLRAEGIDSMHVFHQHESFEWLEKLAAESNYFGISPANDVSVNVRDRWLDKVFKIIGATKMTHAFGVTATSLLREYPFFSADSTTWLNGAKFGSFVTYQPRKSDIVQISRAAAHSNPHFTARAAGAFSQSVTARYSFGAVNFAQYQKFLTDLWASRGVAWPHEWFSSRSEIRTSQVLGARGRLESLLEAKRLPLDVACKAWSELCDAYERMVP